MKNYYFNPKTQDLMIFDSSTNQIDVLEVLKGIRVITSSEMQHPEGDEPVKHWKNSSWDPEIGKAGYKGERLKKAKKAKTKGKWTCKNCGERGHSAKTCKNPQRPLPPPLSKELPDKEVQKIAEEERTIEP